MLVLVQRPQQKNHPRSHCGTKKHAFGTILFEFGDTKKCCTFSGLELAPKSRKKLVGALTCMHKGPKYIQSLWDYPKKFLLCKSTKKARYLRSLGKKNQFWPSQRLKKMLLTAKGCARLSKAVHWPNNNANPSGLSEKKVYCVEKRDMRDP